MSPAARKKSPRTEPGPWSIREVLLENRGWLDYVRGAYSIDPGDLPFYTYLGINFTENAIKNYKFYFAFHRRLTEDELKIVLPVKDRSHFDRLYAQWQPTKDIDTIHRGTTFALKVDRDGALTHYYHMRLPFMPFGPPERLTISPVDQYNLHGVCEEFSAKRTSLKKYYYCADKATIAQTLRIGGFEPQRALVVDLLEYIESDGRDKLTWVTRDLRLIYDLMMKRSQKGLAEAMDELCLGSNTIMYAPGSSRDLSDHAVYFFHPTQPVWPDGIRYFVNSYLGLGDAV